MNSLEAIAILLAERDDPTLRDQDLYKEAEKKVFSDERLNALYLDEKAFYDQQEGMLSNFGLSPEAKTRIKSRLSEAPQQKMISFPQRWIPMAAAFALLLAGAWFVTSNLAGRQGMQIASTGVPIEDLRNFLASNIERGFNLDHRTKSPLQAVTWLNNRAAPMGSSLPTAFEQLQSMGCKILDWNGQKISLICMKEGSGEVVHLFVTPLMDCLKDDLAPLRATHQGYHNMTWESDDNTYLLFGHEKGQELDSLSI